MKTILFVLVYLTTAVVLAQDSGVRVNPPRNEGGSVIIITPNGTFRVNGNGTSNGDRGPIRGNGIIGNGNGTGNGSFSDQYEAQRIQRKRRCGEFFVKSFPVKETDLISNYCSYESVLAASNDEEFSFNSADYVQCLNINRMLAIPEDRFVVDCSIRFKISSMIRKAFPECMNQLAPEYGKLPAYDACQDGTFLSDLAGNDFKICTQNMKYLKQPPEKTLAKCANYSDRNRIVSQRFVNCLDVMKPTRLNPTAVYDFCSKDHILGAISDHNYPACVKALDNVGIKNELNQISICTNSDAQDIVVKNPKCYQESLLSTYRNYFPYVALSSQSYSSDKNFFSFLNRDCKGESKTAAAQNVVASPYLTLVKEFNIHTYETMAYGENGHAQVGGLSALSYDAKTEDLYLLSDETYTNTRLPPRMYVYSLSKDLELKDKKVFPFTFNLAKDEIEPDVDPEGLVHLSTGQFIVSSEIGANEVQKLANKKLQITNLSIFDAKGSYIASLPLPDSFKTKYIKQETQTGWSLPPFSGGGNSNNGSRGNGTRDNRNPSNKTGVINLDGSVAAPATNGASPLAESNGTNSTTQGLPTLPPPPPPPPATIVTYQTIVGLDFNKSLESLSISPDEKVLFTGNESALIQDLHLKGRCKPSPRNNNNNGGPNNAPSKSNYIVKTSEPSLGGSSWDFGFNSYNPPPPCGKVIRIATFHRDDTDSLKFKYFGEYKYELEPEVDNGLSEILALDSNKILTLERSWDSVKQKVTSRIFKIELRDESKIPPDARSAQIDALPALEKKLVIDFDSILSKLSPGFKNIDNLEGMGFGPILASGKPSLLLITDNNYSLKQRTVLLVFEIQPGLLETKE